MVDVSLTKSLTIIPTYSDRLRSVVLRAMKYLKGIRKHLVAVKKMKEDGEEKTSPALTVPEQTESEPV